MWESWTWQNIPTADCVFWTVYFSQFPSKEEFWVLHRLDVRQRRSLRAAEPLSLRVCPLNNTLPPSSWPHSLFLWIVILLLASLQSAFPSLALSLSLSFHLTISGSCCPHPPPSQMFWRGLKLADTVGSRSIFGPQFITVDKFRSVALLTNIIHLRCHWGAFH